MAVIDKVVKARIIRRASVPWLEHRPPCVLDVGIGARGCGYVEANMAFVPD